MRRPWIALGLVAALMGLPSCGGEKKPSEAETAPFAKAIEQYLRDQSMGMKVSGFESLDVSGDTATAKVKMADKDVGYGMRPRWTFTFQKADGTWKVADVKR